MTIWTWIAVALLGGIGTLARFLLDGFVSARLGRVLPVGTFAINISGSLLLGLISGLAFTGNAEILAGSATIGSYTTFSTWMLETHRLREDGQFAPAGLHLLVSYAVGLGALTLGHLIGAHA